MFEELKILEKNSTKIPLPPFLPLREESDWANSRVGMKEELPCPRKLYERDVSVTCPELNAVAAWATCNQKLIRRKNSYRDGRGVH